MTKEQLLAIALFGCVGMCFMLIGRLILIPMLLFRTPPPGVVTGTGVVTGYKTEDRGEGDTRYHPLVTYRDRDGREHSVTLTGGISKTFDQNQQIAIVYDPGCPESVWIVGFNPHRQVWPIAVGFLLAGGLSVMMGAAIWIFRIPVNRG